MLTSTISPGLPLTASACKVMLLLGVTTVDFAFAFTEPLTFHGDTRAAFNNLDPSDMV